MELCYKNNPHSLFRKYSALVTEITRHKLGRDYLGIPYNDISLLLPNGYRRSHGDYHLTSVSSRPQYSKKLFLALARIDTLSNYVLGFDMAVRVLFEELGLIRRTLFIPNVYLTDSAFNPDADPESTTVDGAVRETTSASWATIRGASSGDLAFVTNTTEAFGYLRASSTTNQWDRFQRAFFLFDSSSIPDTDAISAANIQLYLTSVTSQLSPAGAGDIVSSSPASNTNIVTGDFDQVGSTSFGSRTLADSTGDQYNTWTLNASGISNISKTGVSKFGFRLKSDLDDNEPTWDSLQFDRFFGAYADNGSNEPILNVTHAPPSAGDNLLILGVS